MCSELDPLSLFKGLEMGILEPRALPWQEHRRHSVSFVMYISGSKFEEHCSNISGDILD